MTSEEVRKEVIQKEARFELLYKVLVFLCIVLVACFMGIQTYNIKLAQEQRDRILSCTTPNGKCAKEGQKRTAQAVFSIDQQNQARAAVTQQISVYAAYCSKLDNINTVPKFEDCIRKLLAIEGDAFEYESKKVTGGNK